MAQLFQLEGPWQIEALGLLEGSVGSSCAPAAAESNPAQLPATAGEREPTKSILSCLGGGILNFKKWQQNQSRLPTLLTVFFSYQAAQVNKMLHGV